MKYVLDSSALVALLRVEEGAERVGSVIDGSVVSTVNLSEVVALYARAGAGRSEITALLDGLPCDYVAPSETVAFDAGMMRWPTAKAGLSLGDRICLVEARRLDRVALTADRAWAAVADQLGVSVELIR